MRVRPVPTSSIHGVAFKAAAVLLGLCFAGPVAAATLLGSAANFAVLGGSTVTNAGATTVNGNIGVQPGLALTGLETITHTGTIHLGDAVAEAAQADARIAFTTLAGLPIGTDLSGTDLGSIGSLTPGLYSFASAAQLTGSLVLDFTGNAGGSFVFRIGTALTTSTDALITTLGGGSGSSIYWQVGSSATLGTGTVFAGNILADQSITLDTGASILCGRAIALVGAVTMGTSRVSNDCSGSGVVEGVFDGSLGSGRTDFGSGGFAGPIPEPSSWALLISGFGLTGLAMRRRRTLHTA